MSVKYIGRIHDNPRVPNEPGYFIYLKNGQYHAVRVLGEQLDEWTNMHCDFFKWLVITDWKFTPAKESVVDEEYEAMLI